MVVNQYFGNKIIKMTKINIKYLKKKNIKIILKKIGKFHDYDKNTIIKFFKEILPNRKNCKYLIKKPKLYLKIIRFKYCLFFFLFCSLNYFLLCKCNINFALCDVFFCLYNCGCIPNYVLFNCYLQLITLFLCVLP
ncbi:hypothetical protein RFI_36923 [Reticulomyxa filosa]|uniref:Uncharacterized protein n=1 Tax=Reticulomyxa filosa TaxID=46433 RepID=X6LHC0_RETFI|nr:hypothetical protein RFI_36923 [Reticulomyxa filosa]|eukprot:ETO00517.1 hypothetical protein RFI_36923 [Reticulomyxa filosa]